MTQTEISENLEKVKHRIHEAERKSGRESNSVRLCAVSKFHPLGDIENAIKAGQFLFGENRVQEAYEKFSIIKENAHLHIIGSLQTNKVKKAVEIAECIESVDRLSLLEEIEKRASAIGKQIEVFFEIHTGEESKAGFTDEREFFNALEALSLGKCPHVKATGLMTMAPFTEDEKIIRKSFCALRELRERCEKAFPDIPLRELSMGMSGDFEIAIEEGSTLVRVGTAIFGERNYGNAQNG